MAKRGKASRGKRRWLGIEVSPKLRDRESVEASIDAANSLQGSRLYDFVPGEDGNAGLAILRIPLDGAAVARYALDGVSTPFTSITTSGKINLVRKRLGLERSRRRPR